MAYPTVQQLAAQWLDLLHPEEQRAAVVAGKRDRSYHFYKYHFYKYQNSADHWAMLLALSTASTKIASVFFFSPYTRTRDKVIGF